MAKNLVNLVKGGCHSNQLTNFVALDGDKLAYPTFTVCAGILQRFISRMTLLCLVDIS